MRPRGARARAGEGRRGGGAGASPPPAGALSRVHVGSACAALVFVRVLEPSNGLPRSVLSLDCVTRSRPVSSGRWLASRWIRGLKTLTARNKEMACFEPQNPRALCVALGLGLLNRGVVCCRRRQKRAERRRQKARSEAPAGRPRPGLL